MHDIMIFVILHQATNTHIKPVVVAQQQSTRLQSKNLEIVGSIPTGYQAFSSYSSPQWCAPNHVP